MNAYNIVICTLEFYHRDKLTHFMNKLGKLKKYFFHRYTAEMLIEREKKNIKKLRNLLKASYITHRP